MIFKNAFKLGTNIIIAAIISIFLAFSLNAISIALFTDVIGYEAFVFENPDMAEPMEEYTYKHYYEDTNGDGQNDKVDEKMDEYEDMGYIVETRDLRSKISSGGKATFLFLTELFSMMMVVAFASTASYKQGFKDSNMVRTGHRKKDMLKGLKIGLLGNIPFFVVAARMIAASCGLAVGFKTSWYAFISGHFYSFIVWIVGSAETLGEVGVLQHILLVLIQFIVPAISCVAYILGFKEINLTEKLVYKKEVD